MSLEITTAFVNQFRANVMLLSQQRGSRLAGAVMNDTLTGKSGFYDQIGPTSAIARTTRHGDSPLISTPHDRRRVTSSFYEWGDLVDDADKVRMLIDPTSAYAQNMAYAFGRAKDDEIIAAFFADADTGEDGSTAVSFPAANVVAHASAGLTVAKLRDARQILLEGEVDEDSDQFYIACSAHQLNDLLGDSNVTSADFNTVRALVDGKINQYLGFTFIRTERLPVNGSSQRRCPVWAKSGMLLATGKQMTSRITERADKSFSMYVYGALDIGATRMEEAKVVEIPCVEA